MVKYQASLRTSIDSIGPSRTFRYGPVVLLIIAGFFSYDQPVYYLGVFIFLCLFNLLLDSHVPPVLLFTFVFEWFFNQGQLFEAIFSGVSVTKMPGYKPNVDETIMLGLIATASFFIGMFLVARKIKVLSYTEIESFFKRVNLGNLLKVYLGGYLMVLLFGSAIWRFPALVQPIFVLTYFRWSIFFLLFCTVYFQGKFRGILLVLIVTDFFLGFLSFFANFKDVIYFSFISYWFFYFKSSRLARIFLVLTFAFMIYIGSLWSYVKQDYREFLNEGTGAQIVRVSRSEALNKFIDLSSRLTSQELIDGFDQLLLRLSWIGAFNAVHNHVPQKVQHTDGELWKSGVTRPFMPRVLFPDKKTLDDSKELNLYSGLSVDEDNTSISLSMVAGSYVDFGSVGMFIPLFLFGLFCGWVYKKAVEWGRYPVIGYSLTMPMIYLLLINEQSINRIVSSMVLFLLVLWFISKFGMGLFLRFILSPASQSRPKPSLNAPALG